MLEHNGKKITLDNITLEDIEEIFDFDRDVMLQHRLKLGKEYVEKQFPENVEQTSRVKKILARNIELSDPKTFKDPKQPMTYGKMYGNDSKNKKIKIKDFNKKSASRFFRTEKKMDTSRTRWLKG
jgi:predicted transcriptional regulator